MNFNKFTIKSQEAVAQAQNLAAEFGHPEVDVEHLLHALVVQENGLVMRILEKLQIPVDAFTKKVEQALAKLGQSVDLLRAQLERHDLG